jgi:hypothetical protein
MVLVDDVGLWCWFMVLVYGVGWWWMRVLDDDVG